MCLIYISESCSFKVEVVNEEKNGAWKHQSEIFGEYELKSVSGYHGKPHYLSIFESGKYAIWHDGDGRLTIGLSSNLAKPGTTYGFAYNDNHANYLCPYDPAYDWQYKKHQSFEAAGEGLTIRCIGC